MTDPQTPNSEQPGHKGFDYCFWSKLLVAIVLFPLIMGVSFFLFHDIFSQIAVGLCAIVLLVVLAVRLDKMACFAGKIPPLVGKGKNA